MCKKAFKSKSHWVAGSLLAAALNMSVSTANAEEPVVLSDELADIAEVVQSVPLTEDSGASTPEIIEDTEILQEDSVSDEETESKEETLIDATEEKEPEKDESSLNDSTVETFSLNQVKLAPQTHSVKSGEYLYLIGQRYGISVDQIKQWNQLTSNYIYTGAQLIVTKPIEIKPDQSKPIVEAKPSEVKYHTVKPGDYLWKIASAHNINVDQLKQWNKLTSNYIYSGDRLIVSEPVIQAPVDKEPEKAPEKEPVVPEIIPEKPTPTSQYHTVKPGDYLWKIATEHNITVNQLKVWNKLSSNYIYSGDRLIVTDPSISKPETVKPVVNDKDKDLVEVPVKPVTKYYSVKAGDYLWLIATQNGVTINQLKDWNKLSSNYIYVGDQLIVSDPTNHTPVENLPGGTLTGTHQAVQAVLNQYKNSPIHVFYESLLEDDLRTATLRGDDAVYGASVPKVVLIAYTLDQIEKGNLSWDTPLRYTSGIYNHAESYAWGGSGTIQYENYHNKSYTLKDIVYRTIAHSDNLGSNMLLHHVGYRNKHDFDRFTQTLYGASSYTRTMTPRQINKVMDYINNHSEQYAMTALDKTNYDNTKLDTVAANVYQKIGAWWPYYNHSTAIVESTRPYILTILTDYWSDSSIANLAKQIFSAVMR